MKKTLLTLAALCLSLTAYSQRYMQVHMDDSILSVRTDKIDYVDFIEHEEVEHEYVDLGLPSGTLWATCNVGASSPEEYGDYFAWGETTPQTGNTYSWSSYKWCDGSAFTQNKYCIDEAYGIIDNKTKLDPEDDAATVNWGNKWCTPSADQIYELNNSNYTLTTWGEKNGIYGRVVTSRSNGNSIFLPATGYYNGGSVFYRGTYCYYWANTLSSIHGDAAYTLFFSINRAEVNDVGIRLTGQTVRPVRSVNAERIRVSSITLDKTSLTIAPEETATLTASVLPEDAYDQTYTWSSSNEAVATVSSEGVVTGVAEGTATITCTANDGSGVTATCNVTVTSADTHEYVDLGLPSGTLWATCNIGANSPEEYGDYFAWGETTGYNEGKTSFRWSTYTFCNGSYNTMTKYCTNISYGTVDNKTDLDPEDDAAYVNWGSDWCMPNLDQIDELNDSCFTTSIYTTQNGVNGYLITSKTNCNSIFLPAAGSRGSNGSLYSAGSFGNYWSRTLRLSNSNDAYCLFFSSNGSCWFNSSYRSYGQSIRPVRNTTSE